MSRFSKLGSYLGYIGVLTFAGLAASTILNVADWQVQSAWKKHLEISAAELQSKAANVSKTLDAIYHGLRTVSLLPSIRNIDKSSLVVGQDSIRATDQIYNALNAEIDLSEIYVVGAPFDHRRLDPRTGRLEEPLLVFDQLVTDNAGFDKPSNPFAELDANFYTVKYGEAVEIEDEEYVEIKQQIEYYQRHYGHFEKIHGMQIPMVSSPEIVTCDNRKFNKTHNESDRKGIVFSVPFFNETGIFKGIVSATLLTNSIKPLIAKDGYWLQDASLKYEVGKRAEKATVMRGFMPSIWSRGKGETFSTTSSIVSNDPLGAWSLNYDLRVADFYGTSEFRAIRSFVLWSLGTLAGVMLLALAGVRFLAYRTDRLHHAATHDALTGLSNRVLFEEKLKNLMARAKPNTKHAVFYLDLDKFKLINDTLGHHVGDTVLIKSAHRLQNNLRKGDTVARIGGDEFVFLLNNIASVDDAIGLAERMIKALSEPLHVDGHDVALGTSIGIEIVGDKSMVPGEILRHADLALFRAKSQGRGCYRFYEPAMDAVREERRILEADMRMGLERAEFVVHYQPIVIAQSGELAGFEALVRWQHPKRGLVPPMSFIPLAEETGMINAIGEWVLKQACKDAMKLSANMRMAVNLSPIQFRSPSLALHVVTALNESGMAPERLELEITETVLMTHDSTAKEILNQLAKLGVKIALDDFGVGYSSLGHLKSFSFDKIKIDRSFMQDIENPKETAIFRAITDLSTSLGVTTVAEGVETAFQIERAREQGCTELQGYFFGKPGPIEQWVKTADTEQKRA